MSLWSGERPIVAPLPSVASMVPGSDVIVVRDLRDDYLGWVVALHARQFPVGFYSRLGQRFLTAYFRQTLLCPASVGLAVTVAGQGRPVGYLIGSVDEEQLRLDKARRLPQLVSAGLGALAVRPRLWVPFLATRAWLYARRFLVAVRMVTRGDRAHDPVAEVLYVCVEPEFRRHGCGGDLMESLVALARQHGAVEMELTTEESNTEAKAFYLGRGWRVRSSSRARDGRALLRLWRGL